MQEHEPAGGVVGGVSRRYAWSWFGLVVAVALIWAVSNRYRMQNCDREVCRLDRWTGEIRIIDTDTGKPWKAQ